jgi:hypothetical protein
MTEVLERALLNSKSVCEMTTWPKTWTDTMRAIVYGASTKAKSRTSPSRAGPADEYLASCAPDGDNSLMIRWSNLVAVYVEALLARQRSDDYNPDFDGVAKRLLKMGAIADRWDGLGT